MDILKTYSSIWDGWERQCFGVFDTGEATCARGYARRRVIAFDDTHESLTDVYRRVAAHITERIVQTVPWIAMPDVTTKDLYFHMSPTDQAITVIVHANDYFGFTPDDFRHIDRLTQHEETQKRLAAQIDALPEPSDDGRSLEVQYAEGR